MKFWTGASVFGAIFGLCVAPVLAQETPEVAPDEAEIIESEEGGIVIDIDEVDEADETPVQEDEPDEVVEAPDEPMGLCAGMPGALTWIGGDEASSDVMTAGAPFDLIGVSVPSGGEQISVFAVSETGEVRVEAQPLFGGDTVIELYDENGTLITIDDDSGGNLASRAEVVLAPGTYCLLTRSWSGGSVDADVRVATADSTPLTMGFSTGGGFFAEFETCTPDTDAIAMVDGAADAALEDGLVFTASAADAPFYRFSIDSPQAVTITASNEWADPVLSLYDGTGTLIAENDDFNGLDSLLEFVTPLPAGTYCIGLRALSDQQQPITLGLQAYDAERALFDLYASGEVSPPEGSEYPVIALGPLTTRAVSDRLVGAEAVWFSFTVPEGGLVIIDAVEITNSDPVIRLFDASGRMIEFNDDSGATLDSQIVERLGPGDYMLGVSQFSQSYSGVIRVTLERYTLAR